MAAPVEFRAGAERAHPHALFQIWWNEIHGAEHWHAPTAPDHHGQAGTPADVARGESLGSPPHIDRAPSDAPRMQGLRVAPGADPTALVGANGAIAWPVWPMLLLPAWPVAAGVLGLRPRPETPPPRRAPIGPA